MSKLRELFTLLHNMNTICSEVGIECLYEEMLNSIENLGNENAMLKLEIENLNKANKEVQNLYKENESLTNMINEKNLIIKSKDDDINSFKKNSLISSMDKQIMEHKNYIGVLEKQLQFYKNANKSENNSVVDEKSLESIKEAINKEVIIEIIKETIEPTEVILDVDEPEYETYEYNNKKYYKIKKKLYKIKKDGTLGTIYAKIKNGEIILE